MPKFPQFDACMVCEDVRQEAGNKLTILGFFGLTPGVDVRVADLKLPCKLLFLFSALGGGGDFKGIVNFISPDGTTLLIGSLEGTVAQPEMRTIVGLGLLMPLMQAGKFAVQIRDASDPNQVAYQTSFAVSQGLPS